MILLSDRTIELMGKLGLAATGYQRDDVIDASANIILNALRQEHQTLESAQNQFEAMVSEMRDALRSRHYDAQGQRQDRKIVLPARLLAQPVGG